MMKLLSYFCLPEPHKTREWACERLRAAPSPTATSENIINSMICLKRYFRGYEKAKDSAPTKVA